MSYITQTLARRVATVPRAVAVHAPRAFTTSIARQKTPVDSVKDGLKTVDRAVSDKLVDGINVAASAGTKAKQNAEELKNSKAAGKAQELKGEASGKASELKGEAKGAAYEAKGMAKGAAEEVKSKM